MDPSELLNKPPLTLALVALVLLASAIPRLIDRLFQRVDEKKAAAKAAAGDETAGDPALAALLARFDRILAVMERREDHEERLRLLERETSEQRGAARVTREIVARGDDR